VRLLPLLCISGLLLAQEPKSVSPVPANSTAPVYTADGRLVFPTNYREWIYLTTGIDMDYNPDLMTMDHSMFDNIFVNPDAYKVFMATGTWPDKTILVLEGRMAETKGSINKQGHYQTTDVMARSIHLKDESRFPGKWAFFAFDGNNPGKQIPPTAVCYSCHEQHGAVDTTFVQFYPTLLEVAKKKGTFASGYLKDEAAEKKNPK
jgi:hypothetical protein